jgi:ribosomal protein S18 acetylase RimI-like enzyme
MSKLYSNHKNIVIRKVEVLSSKELSGLCEAAKATIAADTSFSLGFHFISVPENDHLSRYFLGALLVPEREQFICEINGVVGGYIELLRPSKNCPTRLFSAEVSSHFVAPWARGNGIAMNLLNFAEGFAKNNNISVIKLSLRQTQEAANKLYEKSGYVRWGSCDKYERINDKFVVGNFYYKEI